MYKVVVRDRMSKKVLFKTVECSDFYENLEGEEVVEMENGEVRVFNLESVSMKAWKLDLMGKTIRLVNER